MIGLLMVAAISTAGPVKTDVKCHDGDTCRISIGGKIRKIRLSGVDAPELDQPYGREARNYIIKVLSGAKITLKCTGKSYDRKICVIFANGKDIRADMVRKGYAHDAPKYSNGKFRLEQDLAMTDKAGLWSGSEIRSPHCWRRKKDKKCTLNSLYQP